MQNYVQKGDTLTLTPTAAVASGEALLQGKIFGVAVAAVAANTPGEFKTTGVYDVAALGTDTATVGAVLYWDNTNKRLTTTASGNTRVGVATAAKANGDATARIKLDAAIA